MLRWNQAKTTHLFAVNYAFLSDFLACTLLATLFSVFLGFFLTAFKPFQNNS